MKQCNQKGSPESRSASSSRRAKDRSPEFSSGQRARQDDERAEPPITELPPLPQFIATPRAQLTSDGPLRSKLFSGGNLYTKLSPEYEPRLHSCLNAFAELW